MSAGASPSEPQSHSILSSTSARRSRTAPSHAIYLPASPPPTSPLPPTPKSYAPLTYPLVPPQRPLRPRNPLSGIQPLITISPQQNLPLDQQQEGSLNHPGAERYPITWSGHRPLIQESVVSPWIASQDRNALVRNESTEPHKSIDSPRGSGSFTAAVFDALPPENWPLPAEWPLPPPSQDRTESGLFTPTSPRRRPGVRRNSKPPTKAVARTPLYIPSSKDSDNSFEMSTENKPLLYDVDINVTPSPRERNEITSLPRWPGAEQDMMFKDPGHISSVVNTKRLIGKRSDVLLRSLLRRRSSLPIPSSGVIQTPKSVSTLLPVTKSDVQAKADGRTSQSRLTHHDIAGCESRRNGGTATVRLPWYIRRRRYMWMLATLIVVLIVSAGVLGGILWRLRHM